MLETIQGIGFNKISNYLLTAQYMGAPAHCFWPWMRPSLCLQIVNEGRYVSNNAGSFSSKWMRQLEGLDLVDGMCLNFGSDEEGSWNIRSKHICVKFGSRDACSTE
eukprot:scaffold72814_cov20-Tisochrysis_lutea.AAC.3